MHTQEKPEPLIVSVHDKGPGRGIAIYFGGKEVDLLEKNGINIRDEKKYLVKPGKKHEVNLIPISALEAEDDNLNTLFELSNQIDRLYRLNKEDKEDFCDEILTIILNSSIDANPRERAAIMQFMKENYSSYILQNVIQVCLRADPEATLEIASKFAEKNKKEVV